MQGSQVPFPLGPMYPGAQGNRGSCPKIHRAHNYV